MKNFAVIGDPVAHSMSPIMHEWIFNELGIDAKFEKNIIELHIAHNDGSYYIDLDGLKKLEDNNLIAFKYCDNQGNTSPENNPNGSIKNIAGIYNSNQNILGIMPHPERMINKYLSGTDGSIFFNNLFKKHQK